MAGTPAPPRSLLTTILMGEVLSGPGRCRHMDQTSARPSAWSRQVEPSRASLGRRPVREKRMLAEAHF